MQLATEQSTLEQLKRLYPEHQRAAQRYGMIYDQYQVNAWLPINAPCLTLVCCSAGGVVLGAGATNPQPLLTPWSCSACLPEVPVCLSAGRNAAEVHARVAHHLWSILCLALPQSAELTCVQFNLGQQHSSRQAS